MSFFDTISEMSANSLFPLYLTREEKKFQQDFKSAEEYFEHLQNEIEFDKKKFKERSENGNS